jgi:hypothetical protein
LSTTIDGVIVGVVDVKVMDLFTATERKELGVFFGSEGTDTQETNDDFNYCTVDVRDQSVTSWTFPPRCKLNFVGYGSVVTIDWKGKYIASLTM